MELADLNTLLIVAREQSFSRAARLLNRTQPAVSLAVRRLEQRTGVSLFTRETRRPELTEAGRLLVAYAQQMCGLQDEARRALVRLRQLRTGFLAIGLEETWCAAVMPIVRRFRELHPDVAVTLAAMPAATALEQVGRGDLDLAVATRVADSTLERVIVARDTFVLAMAPGHPLAARPSAMPADVRRETLITATAAGVPVPVSLTASAVAPFALPSLDAVKRAVRAGLGVAVLPATAVADDVAAGLLAAVPWHEGRETMGAVWLVRSRHASSSVAADRFFTLAGSWTAAAVPPRASAPLRGRSRVA